MLLQTITSGLTAHFRPPSGHLPATSGHFRPLSVRYKSFYIRPYYSTPRGSGKFYLYTNEANGNWQFNPILGSGSAYSYADNGAECPAEGVYYHWVGTDGWVVLPEFKVNIIEHAPPTTTSTTSTISTTSTTTSSTTTTTTTTTPTTTTSTTTTTTTTTPTTTSMTAPTTTSNNH